MVRRNASGPPSPGAQYRSLENSGQPSVSWSSPPNSSMAWWAKSMNDSRSCSSSDVPTTVTSRMRPVWNRWSSPGSSLRRLRSPVAPNRTTVGGFIGMGPACLSSGRLRRLGPQVSVPALGERVVLDVLLLLRLVLRLALVAVRLAVAVVPVGLVTLVVYGVLGRVARVALDRVGGVVLLLVGAERGQRHLGRAGEGGQHLAHVGELGVDAVAPLAGSRELALGVAPDPLGGGLGVPDDAGGLLTSLLDQARRLAGRLYPAVLGVGASALGELAGLVETCLRVGHVLGELVLGRVAP